MNKTIEISQWKQTVESRLRNYKILSPKLKKILWTIYYDDSVIGIEAFSDLTTPSFDFVILLIERKKIKFL